MHKKSFKILHRSSLESLLSTKISKNWAKRAQDFKLNTFQSSERGEFMQRIQQKLHKIQMELIQMESRFSSMKATLSPPKQNFKKTRKP